MASYNNNKHIVNFNISTLFLIHLSSLQLSMFIISYLLLLFLRYVDKNIDNVKSDFLNLVRIESLVKSSRKILSFSRLNIGIDKFSIKLGRSFT